MMFAKKLLIAVLTTVLLLSLNACGSSSTENETDVSDLTLEYVDPAEKTDVSDSDSQTDGNGKVEDEEVGNENILIAYFTAAENSGVDAIASASYSMIDGQAVGRIRAVADMIQDKVGGELFSIQTSVVYPADGAELIDYAAEEQANNARPELITHIENLDQYDTIFIGYPNWWGDMPQVLYSFFDEYDFSGKTIIPFNVHNGSRFSRTIQTIEELEPGTTVIEDGFTVSEQTVADAASDVAAWLEELGY